jgi:lipopolysaccharide/colanic/teichoic acid biosynthesis glycosyltransferase
MLFKQTRIGKNGIPFVLYKLRSLKENSKEHNAWGKFIRNTKLDELPQIINVLKGDMVLIGPRPDLPGYADCLEGEDRMILSVKPGITGLASLKYRNEEYILANQLNPKQYYDEYIWPDKVHINKWYIENKSFIMNMKIIFYTIIPLPFDVDQYISKYK